MRLAAPLSAPVQNERMIQSSLEEQHAMDPYSCGKMTDRSNT
jgi:hypothetical protein